jgi:hypothetical protein
LPTPYAAEVVLSGPSGLPNDEFINTFYFTGAGTSEPNDCFSVASRLCDFFLGYGTVGSEPINVFLTGHMSRTATIKVYVESDPLVRPQALVATFPLGAATSTTGLPEEVALCLSYYAVQNRPRQRGRIYLGPLNVAAIDTGDATVDSRPDPTFIGGIIASATILQSAILPRDIAGSPLTLVSGTQNTGLAVPSAVTWCVRSKLGGAVRTPGSTVYESITGGWVDNEWDGQSRRRIKASARSHFGGSGL